MWTIRRGHQHIKLETLSEYLDGRLQSAALARVDRELASCGACRDELDSLRATVTMLRELPEEAPRSSFTMAAPPPELVRARPAPLFRVPQWAYAGAASLAVIVLVVLVSADTTGLLAPGEPTASRGLAAAPPRQEEKEATSAMSLAAAPEPEDGQIQAPAPAAALPVPAEEAAAGGAAAEPSPPSLALAADAGPAEMPAAAPPQEAEKAATLGAPAGPETESGAVPPEPQTLAAAPRDEVKVPIPGPEPGELPEVRREGTAVIWRVLEGLAAGLGFVFLAGLVMRVKFSRRVDRG